MFVGCSEPPTPVEYQLTIGDNDPPEELFDDDEPTESSIIRSLSSANVSVCGPSCVTTTCSQLTVAASNGVDVAVVTFAIENAYVAANTPGVTSSDVTVDVTAVESRVDQSGCVVVVHVYSFHTLIGECLWSLGLRKLDAAKDKVTRRDAPLPTIPDRISLSFHSCSIKSRISAGRHLAKFRMAISP